MSKRRRATRRDLPAFLLFYGVFIWLFAILFAYVDNGRLAADKPIERISGTVENVFHEYGRSGNYFNLTVQTSDGFHHLTEEDALMRTLPEARRFVTGDTVTAEVRHQSQHNLDWCWGLARNGNTILTIDETHRYLQATTEEHKRFSHKFDLWALAISISFISSAVVLRLHFGSWTDKNRSVAISQS